MRRFCCRTFRLDVDGARRNYLSLVVFGGMDRNKNNPNWQDILLGGTVLTGFAMIAVVAALITLVTWNIDRHTAASSGATVGSSTHASRLTPHPTN